MTRKELLRDHFAKEKFPLVFAHRGYSSLAPENTLSAFTLAKEKKIPGIELDVHICKSGELVVTHDENLKRITGYDGKIKDTEYSFIKDLDAGSWFHEKFRAEKIPLLSEVFESLGKSVYYDIEIKGRDKKPKALEEKLNSLITTFGMEKNCLISSFNPFAIKKIQSLNAKLLTAIIYCVDEEVPKILHHGEGRIISGCQILKPDKQKVSKAYMRFHRFFGGYPVIPWTINDPEEAKKLIELGVDGIISDNPEMIMASLSSG